MNALPKHPALTAALRGTLRHNEPLARHTSWRVGGPAEHFYQPADADDLALFLRTLPEHEPLLWLGLGSNILVRDGGVRGTVIALSGALKELSLIDPHTVRAEAGVTCAKVARFAAQAGLQGAEFLAGIPGTVGGALAMNAGAFGGETWGRVEAVEVINRQGERRVRTPLDYDIGYRHVALKVRGEELGVRSKTKDFAPHSSRLTPHSEEWFLAARLRFAGGDAKQAKARIKELLEKRNQTQPTQLANAGSVFRNPPGDHAARLIETAGLKGHCIGRACVSDKHANFIINSGRARAADIEALIEHVARIVREKHGVQLETEVRIVGEPA